MVLRFEWDENKAEANLQKHGISFKEATTVFGDQLSITINDPLHSIGEDRFVIIGYSYKKQVIIVNVLNRLTRKSHCFAIARIQTVS